MNASNAFPRINKIALTSSQLQCPFAFRSYYHFNVSAFILNRPNNPVIILNADLIDIVGNSYGASRNYIDGHLLSLASTATYPIARICVYHLKCEWLRKTEITSSPGASFQQRCLSSFCYQVRIDRMRDKNHEAVNTKLHSTESTPVEYPDTEKCHLGPYNSRDILRRFFRESTAIVTRPKIAGRKSQFCLTYLRMRSHKRKRERVSRKYFRQDVRLKSIFARIY